MSAARIKQLNEMLEARTGPTGKPIKGYTKNVAAIRGELTRLATPKNPGEGDSP